jgi:signal transduction histidine kinase
MQDPNGKFIIKEMIATASGKGSGWVDYDFANPTTKKLAPKSSYVQKLPGFDGFLGVGVYL